MNPINDWVAFDVETIGEEDCFALQPWRTAEFSANIRTYSLTWVENGKLVSKSTADIDRAKLSNLLVQLSRSGKYIVAWKATFDAAWLIAMGLRTEVMQCKWIDAMILWKNLDRTRITYKLKQAVVIEYPQHAGYEDGIDFEGDIDKLLKYNELDTQFTLLLAIKYWGRLTERERRAVMVDMEDIPVVAARNVDGLELSVSAIKRVADFLGNQRRENYSKLVPHLETFGQFMARGGKMLPAQIKKMVPTFDKKDPQCYEKIAHLPAINLDSDQQLAELLFGTWGLPVFKETPKGAPSVDKESLIELSHQDERAAWIQKYRETTMLISKCVKAPVESIRYNQSQGRMDTRPLVHPELNKSGTVTDRCTYSSSQKSKERS